MVYFRLKNFSTLDKGVKTANSQIKKVAKYVSKDPKTALGVGTLTVTSANLATNLGRKKEDRRRDAIFDKLNNTLESIDRRSASIDDMPKANMPTSVNYLKFYKR